MASRKKRKKSANSKPVRKTARAKIARKGDLPKRGGPSKSAFIRAEVAKGKSAAEIVASGKAAGLIFKQKFVHKVKSASKLSPKVKKAAAAPKAAKARRATARVAVKHGPKPKVGGVSASDFVRSQPLDLPGPELRAAAKKAGIEMSSALVYMVRGKMRAAGGAPAAPKGKPGRKPKAGSVPAATGSSGRTPRSIASAGAGGDAVAFKKLAYRLGIPQAKALIAELERALASLFK